MTGLPAGETARIRDEQGQAALSYRSFASVVGIVAALTAAIVLIAGFAATAFLFAEHRHGAALVGIVAALTAAIVLIAGFAATAFLFAEHRHGAEIGRAHV